METCAADHPHTAQVKSPCIRWCFVNRRHHNRSYPSPLQLEPFLFLLLPSFLFSWRTSASVPDVHLDGTFSEMPPHLQKMSSLWIICELCSSVVAVYWNCLYTCLCLSYKTARSWGAGTGSSFTCLFPGTTIQWYNAGAKWGISELMEGNKLNSGLYWKAAILFMLNKRFEWLWCERKCTVIWKDGEK